MDSGLGETGQEPPEDLAHKPIPAAQPTDILAPCGYPRSCRTKDNGINGMIRASHRQNYVIPPRRNRSFSLVELLT